MKIGIIGGGNMGSALIAGLHKKYQVCVCEQDQKRAADLKRKYGVCVCGLECLAQVCDVIVLAVKPQGMEAVVNELAGALKAKTLVISIAAGITTKFLEKRLPAKTRVVRTMPNMPAQIGEGMTALCKGKKATSRDMNVAQRILGCVGRTVVVDESLIDAVTAISGSGPAYIFFVVECMLKAARSLGVSQNMAKELVYQTVTGSVHQMRASAEEPAVLRERVTSKRGTTEAALKVFMKARTDTIFLNAMKAAKKRSRELAK